MSPGDRGCGIEGGGNLGRRRLLEAPGQDMVVGDHTEGKLKGGR